MHISGRCGCNNRIIHAINRIQRTIIKNEIRASENIRKYKN